VSYQALRRRLDRGRANYEAQQHHLSLLSQYLHEPRSRLKSLLRRNQRFLHRVESFRNHAQSKLRLRHYLQSFQFKQREEFHELQTACPGSRILLSYHFGDFVYGNNVLAACEGPNRRQCFLTQLPSSPAFLANMHRCFGDDFQHREQILTDKSSAAALVAKLRNESCTLLTFADLPAGFGERIEVQFLGRRAWFPKGPAVLALASRTPLVPVLNYSETAANRIILFPAIEPYRLSGESIHQACTRITQRLVDILEVVVLQYAWQWRFLAHLPQYFYRTALPSHD